MAILRTIGDTDYCELDSSFPPTAGISILSLGLCLTRQIQAGLAVVGVELQGLSAEVKVMTTEPFPPASATGRDSIRNSNFGHIFHQIRDPFVYFHNQLAPYQVLFVSTMAKSSAPPTGMTPLNRVASPPLNLYPPNTADTLFQSATDYFNSVPWTAALLKTPRTTTFIPQCFNPASDEHDQYLGKTLAGERGLRHMLCYFTPEDDTHLRDPNRPITKVSSLFALSDGLCGYHKVLHGGMTMSMVDESMGVINEINMALGKKGPLFEITSVTATLEIKFLKPISTDGAVCITAWAESWEGRKSRIRCAVRDETGADLAVCSSTWVSVKAKI